MTNRTSDSISLERYLPLILLLFAVLDLRVDIQIMLDHFTFSSLLFALRNNPLAALILLSTPSIWRHYGLSIRSIFLA